MIANAPTSKESMMLVMMIGIGKIRETPTAYETAQLTLFLVLYRPGLA